MVKYEYIATRLRELRKDRGMSTDELGAKVNRSGKTIEAYEACISQPNADMLIDLCSALDAHISDFFRNDSDPRFEYAVVNIDDVHDADVPSSDERELLKLYRKMDGRARRDLLRIARSLSPSAGGAADVGEAGVA